jgi:hypothetical protein
MFKQLFILILLNSKYIIHKMIMIPLKGNGGAATAAGNNSY